MRRVAAPLVLVLLFAAHGFAHAQEIAPVEPDAPSGFEISGDEPGLQPAPALPAAEAPADEAVDRGIASWYGPRFHGRRTASGERFDMHALTAAHPTLPFGTVVRVESPHDGRSVDVRINDRGPHIKRRVIDLSRAAARALGLLEAGTGLKEVVLKIVRPASR